MLASVPLFSSVVIVRDGWLMTNGGPVKSYSSLSVHKSSQLMSFRSDTPSAVTEKTEIHEEPQQETINKNANHEQSHIPAEVMSSTAIPGGSLTAPVPATQAAPSDEHTYNLTIHLRYQDNVASICLSIPWNQSYTSIVKFELRRLLITELEAGAKQVFNRPASDAVELYIPGDQGFTAKRLVQGIIAKLVRHSSRGRRAKAHIKNVVVEGHDWIFCRFRHAAVPVPGETLINRHAAVSNATPTYVLNLQVYTCNRDHDPEVASEDQRQDTRGRCYTTTTKFITVWPEPMVGEVVDFLRQRLELRDEDDVTLEARSAPGRKLREEEVIGQCQWVEAGQGVRVCEMDLLVGVKSVVVGVRRECIN